MQQQSDTDGDEEVGRDADDREPAVYDAVTVGGGLAGAALARRLATAGARVLVLEKERLFRDRVRGEVLVPWGCAEARELGLFDLLDEGCGHELRFWDVFFDGMQLAHRDLIETTPMQMGVMTFFHPEMQQLVLDAAAEAGADVLRGATVTGIEPGDPPRVAFSADGETHEVFARLVVGADGRNSAVRRWAGFAVERDPQRRFFAGVLLDGVGSPEDAMQSRFAPSRGLISYLFPQGGGRCRAYVGYHAASDFEALSGAGDVPRFLATQRELAVPDEYLQGATAAGPLATFDATETWVEEPYRDGIALIGDAASTSDPTWGQGMSVAMRDVRVLGDLLAADESADTAGRAYAEARRAYHSALHRCDNWYTDLFLDIGAEADERRSRALPLIAQDMTRVPDAPISGPELPSDEATRQRFFGEIEA
ncbi:MAG: NAD(P)/FAD-dependent oxidoreductase [Thermoanaerobaculia bacterium]|nr:NAD(P)/FAD-dependent oxidoreductase [Thermoanaerobaculia bacterium]